MSNYLVTGGAGFIGSHVVESLLKRKHKVTILDDFSTGKQENIPIFANKTQLDVVKGSITNYKLLMNVLKDIDYVIHLAAMVSVPKSIANPKKYNETNVTGTLKILLAAKENNVKKVVFASSSAVYGQIENTAIKENCDTKPMSPYGASKLIGEYYCKLFSNIYALPTVSLRFFNVYGPRQSLAGQYASVIPKFITCVLENESPPVCGDGGQTRDFVYIGDIVSAVLSAVRTKKAMGEVFNVASGKNYSVLSIVNYLNKLLSVKIKPVFMPPRPGDVYRTAADISKIKRILKYRAKVDFMTGLKKTITSYRG